MKEIYVVVSGLAGQMGGLVAEAVSSADDMELVAVGLEGEGCPESISINHFAIPLIPPSGHKEALEKAKRNIPDDAQLIIVDFTHPSAVLPNAELYCEIGIPFVMGTTGSIDDLERARKLVDASSNLAIIAPNMCPQIIAIQAMLEFGASHFPALLSDMEIDLKESHQSTKADTSGTAKAIVQSLQSMGGNFEIADIIMIRDPETQEEIGVPDEYRDGHGYHFLSIRNHDQTMGFGLTILINGRQPYVEGALLGIRWVATHYPEHLEGAYNMIDVISDGA